jgi:phage recombination protein Bet
MSNIVLQQTGALAKKLGLDLDASELVTTLKATAFKGQVSDSQMAALLIVAQQYGLNPWTKEIYAFPDKNNGIVPVVGVDGWSRIINGNDQFDGMEFEQDDKQCTCIIYRKDRAHAVKITEYLDECKRGTAPWQSHPKRMLRHKAMIQCSRIAFGYTGIYDQDEAERIVESPIASVEGVQVYAPRNPNAAANANAPDIEAYEVEHLSLMQDAAMQGKDALAAAFGAMPKSDLKAAFWLKHRDTLHSAATEADSHATNA